MKFKILKESVINEAPGDDKGIDATLPPKYLNDPKPFKITDILAGKKREADRIAKEKEETERKAKERAELEAKYGEVHNKFRDAVKQEAPSDALDVIFDDVVPSSGMADTVAGEIVRAMMRVIYRSYNDGDVYYDGYGLETAAPSMAYITSFDIPGVNDLVTSIAHERLEDDEYNDKLEQITDLVNKYLLNNVELFITKNTTDSRDYDTEVIEELQPEGECYFEYSDNIKLLLDADVIGYDDIEYYFEDWVRDLSRQAGGSFQRPEISTDRYGVSITGISTDVQRELEDTRHLWDDLEDEYREEIDRLNSEDDEDDEYDEDDDIEESLVESSDDSTKVKGILSSRITSDRKIRPYGDDEKLPRGFRFKSGTGDHGTVSYKGKDYAYNVTKDDVKVMPDSGTTEWPKGLMDESYDDSVDFDFTEEELKKLESCEDKVEEFKSQPVKAPTNECNDISCEDDIDFIPDDAL